MFLKFVFLQVHKFNSMKLGITLLLYMKDLHWLIVICRLYGIDPDDLFDSQLISKVFLDNFSEGLFCLFAHIESLAHVANNLIDVVASTLVLSIDRYFHAFPWGDH